MKIAIVGNQVCITSNYSYDEIAKVKRNRPEALKLYQGTGEGRTHVFSVSVDATGGMNSKFLCFGAEDKDINGKAIVMFPVPAHEDGKAKEAVAEFIGPRALYAKSIEQQIDTALTEISNEQNSIINLIEA